MIQSIQKLMMKKGLDSLETELVLEVMLTEIKIAQNKIRNEQMGEVVKTILSSKEPIPGVG